jgi:hypothetical protein
VRRDTGVFELWVVLMSASLIEAHVT